MRLWFGRTETMKTRTREVTVGIEGRGGMQKV